MNNNDYLKICQFARLISRAERTTYEVYMIYTPHVDMLRISIYPNGYISDGYEVHDINCSDYKEVSKMAKYLIDIYEKLFKDEPSKTN